MRGRTGAGIAATRSTHSSGHISRPRPSKPQSNGDSGRLVNGDCGVAPEAKEGAIGYSTQEFRKFLDVWVEQVVQEHEKKVNEVIKQLNAARQRHQSIEAKVVPVADPPAPEDREIRVAIPPTEDAKVLPGAAGELALTPILPEPAQACVLSKVDDVLPQHLHGDVPGETSANFQTSSAWTEQARQDPESVGDGDASSSTHGNQKHKSGGRSWGLSIFWPRGGNGTDSQGTGAIMNGIQSMAARGLSRLRPPEPFDVKIEVKNGGATLSELGIDHKPVRVGTAVKIDRIREGLILDHNRANPCRFLKEQDILLGVQARQEEGFVEGSAQSILAELRHFERLTLKVEPGQARWQWMHRTGWRNYDEGSSKKLERAYQHGVSKCRLKAGKKGASPMEIFFVDMIQYDASSKKKREVQRVGPDTPYMQMKRNMRSHYLSWESGIPRNESFAQYMQRAQMYVEAEDAFNQQFDEHESVTESMLGDREMYHESGCAQALAKSSYFKSLSTFLVVLNAIWMARVLDTPAQTDSSSSVPEGFQWNFTNFVEWLFCALFTCELMVRFLAFKSKLKAFNDAWFRFDAILVILMVFEVILLPLLQLLFGGNRSGVGGLSVLRIARLLRLTRMTRLFKAMPEMLTILKGLSMALRPVFMTLVMLIILIYVFAIIFRSLMIGEVNSLAEERYFPSVSKSMMTLLLHGTFLDSVAQVTNVLADEPQDPEILVGLFIISIFLTSFTVLNMLIGIVCEMVTVVSNAEKERLAKEMLTQQLQDILVVYDSDGTHSLKKTEFMLFMENAEVCHVLSRFEVDVKGLQTLTEVLFGEESDSESELTFEEILNLVVRLKGDNAPTVHDITQMRKYIKHRLDTLEDHIMKANDSMERHIMANQEAAMRRSLVHNSLTIPDAEAQATVQRRLSGGGITLLPAIDGQPSSSATGSG